MCILVSRRLYDPCHEYRMTFLKIIGTFKLTIELMSNTIDTKTAIIQFHSSGYLFLEQFDIVIIEYYLTFGPDLIPRRSGRSEMDILAAYFFCL